jgi:signal transduction histidine kinase
LNLIEATDIAERANRAKSDFLSSMSHELRTPLNSILGFAQLMESRAPTPVQRQDLEEIIKGGWYLRDLISDLLDVGQVESGGLSLAQEPLSLAEVMRKCRSLIEPLAFKRGIGMTFPPLDFPGQVRADRTRLKQVVINLLSNAIKYNRSQGTVAVHYALSAPDVIRVSVRDTGEGLAPKQLAQLFQPFNRLGKEGGLEEGTGIGLVLSRHLVELMGGTLGADSTVGVGSVFWFELQWMTASQVAPR